MKKLYAVLILGVLLLSATSCRQTLSESEEGLNVNAVSTDVLLTDEELIDRTLYLYDMYVLPVYWWTGAGSDLLAVWENESVEPLHSTPEGTTFYQIMRFNNIKEMKRATEQVVTRKYAEAYLYPLIEENQQFLEKDDKLYMNTSAGGGRSPLKPVSATVLSKTATNAELNVVFQEYYFEEVQMHKIELERENGIWKLNNTPYVQLQDSSEN